MKINIEVDLSPEELRAFLGLPDVKPLQDEMLRKAGEQLASGSAAQDAMGLMAPFLAPQAGAIDAFQRAFWQTFANATGAGGQADESEPADSPGGSREKRGSS